MQENRGKKSFVRGRIFFIKREYLAVEYEKSPDMRGA